ncbi:MAG: Vms1/Ankzf1 family peptidyl-tRNA hydrolase [Candidatus Fermentibacteraceae bacterium]
MRIAALDDVDLQALSALSAPDRAFLSVYLHGRKDLDWLEARLGRAEDMLAGDGGSDEAVELRRNAEGLMAALRETEHGGPLAGFSCWLADLLLVVPLELDAGRSVHIDSSPYIRPLAELREECETSAAVIADNTRTVIRMVTCQCPGGGDEQVIRGNVKNHVRKGGWSQQRYERRRNKELLHYAKDVVQALRELRSQVCYTRLVLIGSRETMSAIVEQLPPELAEMAMVEAVDLKRPQTELDREIAGLLDRSERESERERWRKIRSQHLSGGLGEVGFAEVMRAASEGRVEEAVISRSLSLTGTRCRECGHLDFTEVSRCPACGSESVFPADLVEELVDRLESTGAEVDFTDPIESLDRAGGVGALLRWRNPNPKGSD